MSLGQINKCLSRSGYILKKTDLTQDQQTKIRKDLTMHPQVLPAFRELGIPPPKPFKTYVETNQAFYLPRYYGLEEYGEPEVNRVLPGKSIALECVYGLLPHQIKAWDVLTQHFEAGKSGVMSMFCGGGKTSLAIRLACHLKSKTLVVVNTEVLMEQWRDRISQFTGGRAKIGTIQKNIVDYQDCDFVVTMLHSLSLKEYDPAIFEEFDLTIIDECHHVGAATFSRSLPKIASRYMLGLSATPDRNDGLSLVFYRYLGPLFYSQKREGNNQVMVKSLQIKSDSAAYRVEYFPNGTKKTSTMVSNIAEFPTRNLLIVEILGLLTRTGRKILLLSGRREQLEIIKEAVDQKAFLQTDGTPVTTGLYYGANGVNKKKHRALLEVSSEAQIILGTTNIAQEGLDIPALNTLFLISSLSDVEQASGRILRKYHENLNPLIVDLVDQTGNFPRHFKKREAYYKSENYQIDKLSIKISDDLASVTQAMPRISKYFESTAITDQTTGIENSLFSDPIIKLDLLEAPNEAPNKNPEFSKENQEIPLKILTLDSEYRKKSHPMATSIVRKLPQPSFSPISQLKTGKKALKMPSTILPGQKTYQIKPKPIIRKPIIKSESQKPGPGIKNSRKDSKGASQASITSKPGPVPIATKPVRNRFPKTLENIGPSECFLGEE